MQSFLPFHPSAFSSVNMIAGGDTRSLQIFPSARHFHIKRKEWKGML